MKTKVKQKGAPPRDRSMHELLGTVAAYLELGAHAAPASVLQNTESDPLFYERLAKGITDTVDSAEAACGCLRDGEIGRRVLLVLAGLRRHIGYTASQRCSDFIEACNLRPTPGKKPTNELFADDEYFRPIFARACDEFLAPLKKLLDEVAVDQSDALPVRRGTPVSVRDAAHEAGSVDPNTIRRAANQGKIEWVERGRTVDELSFRRWMSGRKKDGRADATRNGSGGPQGVPRFKCKECGNTQSAPGTCKHKACDSESTVEPIRQSN